MAELALQAMTPSALADALAIDLAEARKIVSAVHRERPLDRGIAGVRRESLAAARAFGTTPSLEVVEDVGSQLDPFRKLVLKTPHGDWIETVRIPLERAGRFSVCVSSQVGCALACAFCATGRMGLRRNLEAWEIVEQVRHVVRRLPEATRVHGVVFQGMGEPMANLDRVLQAIAVLTEPSAMAIDTRNITVCTSGLPSGIRRLAQEAPKVRLGISLGSARLAVRKTLMPIEASHSLTEVVDAAIEHARATSLSPMWAVTLLAGVNDSDDDARALADLVADFTARAGVRPRLSVIPYNAIDEAGSDPFTRTDALREEAFRDVLRARGVPTHKRYSGGGDVAAACGQLATTAPERVTRPARSARR